MGMKKWVALAATTLTILVCAAPLMARKATEAIPAGSKVFIEPMGGFETYLRAALIKKKVPLVVVDNKADAAFDISGHSTSQKASATKEILTLSWRSSESATIQVTDLKSGEIVYAYSYHNNDSAHGKKSSAEACAKHLRKQIE